MHEIEITVTGNVCSEVTSRPVSNDREVTSFSLAVTPRVFKDGQWQSGVTSFFNVGCFGALGRNVFASVHKGDPVLVRGRLRIRTWEKEGARGTSADIEATCVGHDLVLGTSTFARPARGTAPGSFGGADPWGGIEPAVAAPAQAAGLTPERVEQDLASVAA